MIRQEEWELMIPGRAYKAKNSIGQNVRIAKESSSGFVFAKSSSKYGRRFDTAEILENYTLAETVDENIAWHKRLNRAIKAMTVSGLWANIRELFTNLLEMNYYDKQKMQNIYWEIISLKDMPAEEYNQTFLDKFAEYYEKYAFAFYEDKEGKLHLHTDYIFEISDCKLKSMYFGFRNKKTKEEIKEAIVNNTSYSLPYPIRTSYDVSFRYNAEKKSAIYAEEYKGCGNGHYYLALNENIALFAEND